MSNNSCDCNYCVWEYSWQDMLHEAKARGYTWDGVTEPPSWDTLHEYMSTL